MGITLYSAITACSYVSCLYLVVWICKMRIIAVCASKAWGKNDKRWPFNNHTLLKTYAKLLEMPWRKDEHQVQRLPGSKGIGKLQMILEIKDMWHTSSKNLLPWTPAEEDSGEGKAWCKPSGLGAMSTPEPVRSRLGTASSPYDTSQLTNYFQWSSVILSTNP